MWESPIQMISEDIIKDIVEKQDGYLIELVHRCGFDVNEEELKRALLYDRNQWERGYADGKMDGYRLRDVEIVQCKDCKFWHREIYNGIEYFNFSSCDLNHHGDGNNFYCADGERREDATLH